MEALQRCASFLAHVRRVCPPGPLPLSRAPSPSVQPSVQLCRVRAVPVESLELSAPLHRQTETET
eukprot:1779422-Rhodomonas_salina.1